MLKYLIIISFFLLLFGQAQLIAAKGKIVMIIAPDGFRDEELLVPKQIFEENGYEVVVASRELKECYGMLGAVVMPDITINDINPDDYVAIVMVGGVGATTYFDDPVVQELLNKFYEKDKVVSAICLAPVTLAKAGLLQGKKATVWKSEGNTLKKEGAIYTGEPVTQDGRIVTGAGPFAAEEFARYVLKELKEKER